MTSENPNFSAKYTRIASTDKSGRDVEEEDVVVSSSFVFLLSPSDSFSLDLLESSPTKKVLRKNNKTLQKHYLLTTF